MNVRSTDDPMENAADKIRKVLAGLSEAQVDDVLARVIVDHMPDAQEGDPKFVRVCLSTPPYIFESHEEEPLCVGCSQPAHEDGPNGEPLCSTCWHDWDNRTTNLSSLRFDDGEYDD